MEFKSVPQILDYFKDEETGIKYMEEMRWGGNPVCPHCESENPYKIQKGYKCSNKECHKKFTVKVGTIFESSKIKFRIWYAAIFLFTTSKKGVSSVYLSSVLGITQKTAWFMTHRIRKMLQDDAPNMLGGSGSKTVEIDEAFIGGIEGNKHYKKKRNNDNDKLKNDGTAYKPKMSITGIVERNGKVVLKYTPEVNQKYVYKFIKKHVDKSATIYTDEAKMYLGLKKMYTHDSIMHKLGKYVRGSVHTNTIENFWSVLKRGIHGSYHHISEKHIERYLDEFSARYNTRDISNSKRFEYFLRQSNRVLTYEQLISED